MSASSSPFSPIAAAVSSGRWQRPAALTFLPVAAGRPLFQFVAAVLSGPPSWRRLAGLQRPFRAAARRIVSPSARHSSLNAARPLGRNGADFASRSGRFLFPLSCGPP